MIPPGDGIPPPGDPGWGPPAGSGAPSPGWSPPPRPSPSSPTGPPPSACYRHAGRPAGARCRRCGRPICPECMREAPVGWQCPQCIHDDHRRAPVTHWRPSGGGTLGASRLTPLVMALVALNAVIFLYEETNFDSIVFRFALIPAFTTNEPYRLVTAAFLHASFTHILLNMVGLIVIGPAVESAVGRTRFVILYLLAAVGGEVASYLVGPLNEVSLGASGAVFGLFGAYYVLARRRRWDTQIVLVFIAINLAYSFLDTSIDWRAHVGGLAVGAGVAAIYNRCESLPAVTRPWVETAAYAGVLVAIAVLSRLPAGHIGV